VAGKKRRIAALDIAVHAHAEIDPATQQIAVMVGAMVGVPETRIRFVVTAPGAQISDAAGLAVGPFAVERLSEERAETLTVDAAVTLPNLGISDPVNRWQRFRSPSPSTASNPTPAPQGSDLRRPWCKSVINWCMLEKPLFSSRSAARR